MAKINISGKEYNLRYTIESWKKLKANHEITPINAQEKISEDAAECLSALILFGLSPEDRKEVNVDQIDAEIDFSCIDIVTKSIMESMPASLNKSEEENQDGKK